MGVAKRWEMVKKLCVSNRIANQSFIDFVWRKAKVFSRVNISFKVKNIKEFSDQKNLK